MKKNKPKRPTLVWPGKDACRPQEFRSLRLLELHGEMPSSDRLPNLLIQGDNRLALCHLLHTAGRKIIDEMGGLKLVYIDPPFAVGADFSLPLDIADKETIVKKGAFRALAYRDTWADGLNSFLSMMYERLVLIKDLLAEDGSLYVHCDWRSAPCLRLLLDEIFGAERFLGDIVWHYTGGGRSKRWFSRKHDRLLHYAASRQWFFNPDAIRVPYKSGSGYAKSGITSAAGKHYAPHSEGTPVDDVWDIPMINPLSKERSGYPTQKPEALLERVLLASSRPGDLVADFFCGSGGVAAVAERLGRRWLAVDSSPLGIHAVRKRLLQRRLNRSFAVLSIASAVETPRTPFPAHELAVDAAPAFHHVAWLPEGGYGYIVQNVLASCRRGHSGVICRIDGFSILPDPNAPSIQKKHLTALAALFQADWRLWLDYWSVGMTPGSGFAYTVWETAALYNTVIWSSSRQKGVPLALSTPPLALPASGGCDGTVSLAFTLVDIFGNASRLLVPVALTA